MPYQVSDMMTDDRFKGMPKHAMEIFAAAFNSASEAGNPESRCFQIAWAAVEKKYRKNDAGDWEAFSADLPDLIEREAKLFEAGDYPDRKLNVTEDDLDVMVAGHPAAGLPLKIEHADSALDGAIGFVKSIYRKGKELFGRLAFTRQAWALLDAAGAKKLSCAVKRDKSGITEVSIVANPRIADARVFADTDALVRFSADFGAGTPPESATAAGPGPIEKPAPAGEEVTVAMADEKKPPTEAEVAEARRILQAAQSTSKDVEAFRAANRDILGMVQDQNEQMVAVARESIAVREEMQKSKASTLVAQFKRDGKVLPAAEGYALAILRAKPLASSVPGEHELVTFSDKDGKETPMHFAEAFVAFLEAMSPAISFREIVRAEAAKTDMPESEKELYRKMGVDPEKVAALA